MCVSPSHYVYSRCRHSIPLCVHRTLSTHNAHRKWQVAWTPAIRSDEVNGTLTMTREWKRTKRMRARATEVSPSMLWMIYEPKNRMKVKRKIGPSRAWISGENGKSFNKIETGSILLLTLPINRRRILRITIEWADWVSEYPEIALTNRRWLWEKRFVDDFTPMQERHECFFQLRFTIPHETHRLTVPRRSRCAVQAVRSVHLSQIKCDGGLVSIWHHAFRALANLNCTYQFSSKAFCHRK